MHEAPPNQRFNRRGFWMSFFALLLTMIAADHQGLLLVRSRDDLATYHARKAMVINVVDGDTFDIDLPDTLADRPFTRVRLSGIDCPEVASAARQAEPFSQQALDFSKSRLDGQSVLLWLESHQPRDVFSRVLAHVELGDGTRLNELLLEAGLARTDERWPHSMLTRYAQVEHAARRRQIGIWSAGNADSKRNKPANEQTHNQLVNSPSSSSTTP